MFIKTSKLIDLCTGKENIWSVFPIIIAWCLVGLTKIPLLLYHSFAILSWCMSLLSSNLGSMSESQSFTLKMFHQISNHLEVGWKTLRDRPIFIALFGAWISNEKFLLFDIFFGLLNINAPSRVQPKENNKTSITDTEERVVLICYFLFLWKWQSKISRNVTKYNLVPS